MKSTRQFACTLNMLLLVCLFAASGTFAQKGANKKAPPLPPPQVKPANPPANSGNGNKGEKNSEGTKNTEGANPNQNGKGQGNARQMVGLPPKWVESLQDMSPEQQQRFMKNNDRFKRMSPEEQAQIRQNLQHWNGLSPQERMEFRRRAQAFEQMTPQERQYVRQELIPRLRNMPPAQRANLIQHVHQLDGLSEADREARLNDPAFYQGLTPEERQMLPYMFRLRVGFGPEPPAGPPEF